MRTRRRFGAGLKFAAVTAAGLAAAVMSGGEARAFTTTSAGYVCVDNEEPGDFAPMFSWDDNTVTGGTLVLATGNGSQNFNMPFNFNYMGAFSPSWNISANGYITRFFVQTFPGSANGAIPSAVAPNNTIYPFWDDLNPINQGGGQNVVRTQTMGLAPNRRHVFTWNNVAHALGSSFAQVTFQVTFFEAMGANAFRFQYLDMNGSGSDGESATVGMENAAGSAGIQYENNGVPETNNIYDGLAIGFYPQGSTPPWTALPSEPEEPEEDPEAQAAAAGPPPPPDPGKGERHTRRCAAEADAGYAGVAALSAILMALALSLYGARAA